MTGPGWLPRRRGWLVARSHLSEDHLSGLALDRAHESGSNRRSAEHLRSCRRCEDRYRALAAQLDSVAATAEAGFDAIFTPSRLQSQRDRITRRLATLVGHAQPARVLAFPLSSRSLPGLAWTPRRWIPAAVAAGLLLGVTAGQLIHLHPEGTEPPAASSVDAGSSAVAGNNDTTEAAEWPSLAGAQAGAVALALDAPERLMAEDEFLGILDRALTSVQVSELQSIDALTPRVRDIAVNIR